MASTTALEKLLAVVGGHDNHRVLHDPALLESLPQLLDPSIDARNLGGISHSPGKRDDLTQPSQRLCGVLLRCRERKMRLEILDV